MKPRMFFSSVAIPLLILGCSSSPQITKNSNNPPPKTEGDKSKPVPKEPPVGQVNINGWLTSYFAPYIGDILFSTYSSGINFPDDGSVVNLPPGAITKDIGTVFHGVMNYQENEPMVALYMVSGEIYKRHKYVVAKPGEEQTGQFICWIYTTQKPETIPLYRWSSKFYQAEALSSEDLPPEGYPNRDFILGYVYR